MMEMLNEYFSSMVEGISLQKGLLDKFVGDAILAVFGLPYPQSDDANRAARAALVMKESLDLLNARRLEYQKPPIRNSIGINTDEIISGDIGSEQRMNYTVIGDGVNLASRLEGLNKVYGTQIILSESTRKCLDDAYVVRRLDRVVVKGKSRPIQIFELLGESDSFKNTKFDGFEDGWRLYENGDFSAALECFERGASDDEVSRKFVERCRHLQYSPLPADWDGIWTFYTK